MTSCGSSGLGPHVIFALGAYDIKIYFEPYRASALWRGNASARISASIEGIRSCARWTHRSMLAVRINELRLFELMRIADEPFEIIYHARARKKSFRVCIVGAGCSQGPGGSCGRGKEIACLRGVLEQWGTFSTDVAVRREQAYGVGRVGEAEGMAESAYSAEEGRLPERSWEPGL